MFKPERLAYWYLRLNGFSQFENFLVHVESGQSGTDADLIGVRFRDRRELLTHSSPPLPDDGQFIDYTTPILVVVAEVKANKCALNETWTNSAKTNVQRALRAIGCYAESEVEIAANAIYKTGCFRSEQTTFRLLAFGDKKVEGLIPSVPQTTFNEMLSFIFKRLNSYFEYKRDVEQWSKDGKYLQELVQRGSKEQDFINRARPEFGLSQEHR